jgi:hypothetical protein
LSAKETHQRSALVAATFVAGDSWVVREVDESVSPSSHADPLRVSSYGRSIQLAAEVAGCLGIRDHVSMTTRRTIMWIVIVATAVAAIVVAVLVASGGNGGGSTGGGY